YLLEGSGLDVTGREGVAGNDRGRLGEHDFQFRVGERLAIQRAEVLRLANRQLASAEALFPAQIQRQAGPQPGAIVMQETRQAAEVVVVTVAEDQRIEVLGCDPQHRQVVVESPGSETE